jgi:hypothetical protein
VPLHQSRYQQRGGAIAALLFYLLRSDDLPGPPAENAGPRGRPVSNKKLNENLIAVPCSVHTFGSLPSLSAINFEIRRCGIAVWLDVIFMEVEQYDWRYSQGD